MGKLTSIEISTNMCFAYKKIYILKMVLWLYLAQVTQEATSVCMLQNVFRTQESCSFLVYFLLTDCTRCLADSDSC